MSHAKDRLHAFSFTPSLDSDVASQTLAQLLHPREQTESFLEKTLSDIQRLDHLYQNFCRYASPPWPSTRLAITNENIYQSELWLPMSHIAPAFIRFLNSCLTFPPLLQHTSFSSGSSWAEFVTTLPCWVETTNPATLLNLLLLDYDFRIKFIFWLFMPRRYYGTGSDRYPIQMQFLTDWITRGNTNLSKISILDAAAGDGEALYACAGLLFDRGFGKDNFYLEGWALDPLENWSAAHIRFCHNPERESEYRMRTEGVFRQGISENIVFRTFDLTSRTCKNTAVINHAAHFDVVLCNGLLFGPLLNNDSQLRDAINNLAIRMKPDALLLFENHFHNGWKMKFPTAYINDLLSECGLLPIAVERGNAAIKKGVPL